MVSPFVSLGKNSNSMLFAPILFSTTTGVDGGEDIPLEVDMGSLAALHGP